MFNIIVAILIVLAGAGGAAYVADKAGPGDALFPVDRAMEKTRLALASSSKKNELRVRVAEERLEEIKKIIRQEDASSGDMGNLSEVEADVFLNETVVRVEFSGGAQEIFITSANTREDIVRETAEKFGVSSDAVDGILNFEIEDRASRPDDKNIRGRRALTDDEKVRVASGMQIAAETLAEISGDISNQETKDRLDKVIEALSLHLDSFSEDFLEMKREENETSANSGNNFPDTSLGVSNDANSSVSSGQDLNQAPVNLEIEADVFSDITLIKVELNGGKTFFTTTSRTREGVIMAVLTRFRNLNRFQVEPALDFEIEDRASRPDDWN